MKEFMEGAIDDLGNVKPDNWTQPADIKVLPAFHSDVPYSTESPPPSVDLFPSWYAGKSTSTVQTIDKVSGMPATSCTPTDARETIGGGSASSLNVDIYKGGRPNISATSSSAPSSSAADSSDNVHSCSDSPPTATITAVNGIPADGSSQLTCPASGSCTIMVHVEQGTHALTDPNYPDYPGTLALVVNGQTVQSQPVDSSGDYQLTYTPPSGTTGGIQVTAQVTDSVLYQGSDTQTIVIPNTTSFSNPTTSAGGGPEGFGSRLSSFLPHGF